MFRYQKAFGLTEEEALWDKVYHHRLMEILSDSEVQICEVMVSRNSWGEFLFIKARKQGEHIGFYGLGFHEYRERFIIKYWCSYMCNPCWDGCKTVSKDEVFKAIEERREKVLKMKEEWGPIRRSESARTFSMLSDVSDEDGVYTFMEDMGLL